MPKFRSGGGIGTDFVAITAEFQDPAGNPVAEYTIGDSLVMVVNSTEAVWLGIYVDEGDTLFDAGTDLWFSPGDGGDEEIIIRDGDYDDEDTTSGVWKMTFTPESIEDEEMFFLLLQNQRLFFYFTDSLQTIADTLTMDILPKPSITSVSGTVTLADEITAAPNMVIVAFPSSAMTEEGPPGDMYLSMTGAAGEYTISVDDDAAVEEFFIFAIDMWGLYFGLYPDPGGHMVPLSAGVNQEGIDFKLIEVNSAIAGILTDEVGSGIGGVRVGLDEGSVMIEDTTLSDGTFLLPVPAGWWRIRFDKWDLANLGYMIPPEEEGVEVPENDTVGVSYSTFAADGFISGHVERNSGGPAVGVEIHADRFRYSSVAETDANGDYILNVSTVLDTLNLEGGEYIWYGYWVNAWSRDAITVPDGYNEISPDTTGIDFILYGTDALAHGHIYDEATNEPVERAWVNAYTIGDSLGFSHSTGTWGDGYYEVPLISGFEWVLEIYRPEMWRPAIADTFIVYTDMDRPKDYYLPAVAHQTIVEGNVLAEDSYGNVYGLSGAEVFIRQFDGVYNRFGSTDPDGHFIFDDVPTFSEYEVQVSASGFDPQYANIWVEVEPYWLEFYMSGNIRHQVSGTITNETGDPLWGAFIFAYHEASTTDPYAVTQTWDDGTYELFLEPGIYSLQAGATGYLVTTEEVTVVDSSLTVDFVLSEPGEDQLTAQAHGLVMDPDGTPIPSVFVLFTSGIYVAETWTDYNGDYGLDLYPDTTYRMAFFREGFHDAFSEVYISDGDNPLANVTMDPMPMLAFDYAVDVLVDHGGKIALGWHVSPMILGRIASFEIWEVGRGAAKPGYPPERVRYLGSHPAHPEVTNYEFIARTLHNNEQTWYVVTAHGWDFWDYWDTGPDYAVATSQDNLPPSPPTGVIAEGGETADQVVIGWDAANIEPIQYYTIYRSVDGGAFERLAYSAEPGFVDNLTTLGSYEYAVSATDYSENKSDRSVAAPYTFLSIVDGMGIPDEFALRANYPNPFNPSTTIGYQLPEAGRVSLVVYDLTGNVVSTLVNENQPAGYYQTVWNGRDRRGVPVATGVYFYRLEAGAEFVKTHKMVLMK